MADAVVNQYWCHMCCRMVNPVMEPEVKCPICESGFVEEVAGGNNNNNNNSITDLNTTTNYNNNNSNSNNDSNSDNDSIFGVESEHAFSLWAPILLGLMDGLRAYRPSLAALPAPPTNAAATDNEEDEQNHQQEHEQQQQQQQHILDREFESLLRRRRTRSSVSFLRLLQDIRARAESTLAHHHNQESDEYGTTVGGGSRNSRLILVDPFNEGALILHGPPESTRPENAPSTTNVARSFADYLVGPGLDLLLQHLAENDPNRHGTPPAQKEAVNAMPTVTIHETNLQCAVCLEDFEHGAEAKEMPCKHKFHEGCIHPWLELHSSCPVCRFQMPTDDSKTETNGANGGVIVSVDNDGGGGGDAGFNFMGGEEVGSPNERRRHQFPFPFDTSLSFLGSRSGVGNYVPDTSSPSSSSSTATSSAVLPLLGDSTTSREESRGQEQP